jgi:transposase InsO family protein
MNAPITLTPVQLDEAINANSTPAELAAAIAPHWLGAISNVEIAEDMHGWSVRVTVKLSDRRKRDVTWAESGESRGEAVRAAMDAASAWASIHGDVS